MHPLKASVFQLLKSISLFRKMLAQLLVSQLTPYIPNKQFHWAFIDKPLLSGCQGLSGCNSVKE